MKNMILLFLVLITTQLDSFAQEGWFQQTSGTTANLSSVCFVDESNGWAVGDSGTILHSTDGGNNWTAQTSPTTDPLKSVQFANRNKGWIVGDNWATTSSKLLRTTDGGDNWVQICDTLPFFSLSFIDSKNGWANGTIKTTDGGNSWSVLNTYNYFWLLEFVDFNFGWGFGKPGLTFNSCIFKTTDGGENWETLQCFDDNESISVNSICFTDSVTGWYVTTDSNYPLGGVIYNTTDGGDTWQSQYYSDYPGFNDIFMLDYNYGWAAGKLGNYTGFIVHTSNGDYWTMQDIGNVPPINSIHFVDSITGWAVGLGGTILKTTTGGVVSVDEKQVQDTPTKYFITQNFPNPFNSSTAIQYSILKRSNVILKVYDILGNEVTTLVNEEKDQGVYTINIEANNFASGLYLYRIQAGSFIDTKKMILLK